MKTIKRSGLKKLPVIILFLTVCYSCNPKQNYINNFEKFVIEVENQYEEYTEQDWADADQKFELYAVDEYKKFKEEMTREERKKVNKLKGKYIGVRAKAVANGLIDELEDKMEEILDGLDGLLDEFAE